ncbi:DNA mismatch repair protein MSH6, putative [Plasmodium knowlesi strain H]|uniref:DNA mismatch repair protein n=3 Tax=Plasmodium knowlesi TaxID=5850 RepID=A0A5K1V792_PLAKH|nr:DNA mismatch repair protein MSH6, putative [Plasmodium knowlesi strain H]OTN67122.1 putative DNA mismatch repair protein MSH6 [Plasmodium knowlesi]CAA9988785.1 DNA mismatch repair protein MSH6, putative [Plasmodium knowlesi strain H]SBO21743.1 DNA mismatch repair protein MSH6, putative [Plasmodium knowlesi strain H]SBO22135.1 DNA mismatch repair protein MSH6, putative [Plasmodium knowlesi strain H]VVS78259.1 DNA mismatch repair protein MSH6, putative [Plasmodium knowlesi strain H]|eukprot:XP_002259762.1 DNA repair protein, putative [Plasmodium knowlesi strain H]
MADFSKSNSSGPVNRKQASILSFFKTQDVKGKKVTGAGGEVPKESKIDADKNGGKELNAAMSTMDKFAANVEMKEEGGNEVERSSETGSTVAKDPSEDKQNGCNTGFSKSDLFSDDNEDVNTNAVKSFVGKNEIKMKESYDKVYGENNEELSTDEDIIVRKKRKIIMDSSSEDVYDGSNEVSQDNGKHPKRKIAPGSEGVGVDGKLSNLVYEANKCIKTEETLFTNEKSSKEIMNINRRKGEDGKKSQELDTLRNKFLSMPICLSNDKFRLYIEQYFLYCNTFEFPKWVQPQYIRDLNLRTPDNADYDSSTIWTPPQDHPWAVEYKQAHYTPGMQQFWKIKSKNFDKIIFFKMGRFYEIFYIDACLMHTICGLNWMGGEQKPHLGFPEQSLHLYAKKVINSGHKVVVIEQMETPKELEQRNKETCGPKDKAIKREINEIYTKGTILHDNMLSSETRYLICFHFDDVEDLDDGVVGICNGGVGSLPGSSSQSERSIRSKCNFGFVVSDIATSYIAVGYCNDDESRIELRTILAQLCPAEILYASKNINKEVLSIFKNIPAEPELTGVSSFPNIIASLDEIRKYFETIPPSLEMHKEQNSVICAFGGFIVYLRSLLLDKKIFRFCKIEHYDLFKRENYMVLDATALKHLEILETQSGETKNSLFDYVNKTCTNFGARNMRRWICSPLLDCTKINERLDVVDFLKKNEHILSLIRLKLKKLPDIERLLNKICIQASQSERGAVFFDNIVNTKLKEFMTFLNAFKEIGSMLIEINSIEKDEEELPKRLFEISNTPDRRSLVKNIQGNYPHIEQITTEFLKKIEFDGDKEYKPAEGCDEAIDQINKKEREVEIELNNILTSMKKKMKISSLKYVHAKYKYEVECPENVPKVFLKDVEITSAKKGFIRFQNDEIKQCVEMLEDIVQEKKDAIYPFFKKIFHLFYAHYEKYVSACRLVSELDCLQAFAFVALNTSFVLTRPILHPMRPNVNVEDGSIEDGNDEDGNVENGNDENGNDDTGEINQRNKSTVSVMGRSADSHGNEPFLILENNIHPVVATLMPNFISNNIYMGCKQENQSTLLLTGPNMGGKSTLLRQTAISVILAQIGAFVPSTYCELTVVDKIFTRLGSSDNLFEGKSTFLVELEDISNMLKQSTKYSLAILDELGRGTSSFDGTAIALSTLEQISDVVKCRCIFSTHYHLLVEEVKHNNNISNYHMSLSIDDQQEKIIFLYKFIKGVCPKSFGIHIAKLAGLPKEIIDLAHEKSTLFENVTDEFCKIIKYKNIVRSLLSAPDDQKLGALFRKYRAEFTS